MDGLWWNELGSGWIFSPKIPCGKNRTGAAAELFFGETSGLGIGSLWREVRRKANFRGGGNPYFLE